jgi:ABC-type dipeptide/oligopeptide/nickel transport system permease component
MRQMALQIIKRAAMLIVMLFGMSLLSFSLSAISPVDPAEVFARRTSFTSVTPERAAEIRIQMGLDKPL